jgi:CRP/FNR family cyclic AMP-dependent transcriptional regulator
MTTEDAPPRGPLGELSEEDLQALLEYSRAISCRVDQVVLQQGHHNGSIFFVQKGILHVRRYGEGREVLLGRLEPGGFFGDISLFDPGPTTAAVVAVSPAELIEIRGEDLQRFIDARPAAAARFLSGLLKEMANRLRRTDERLVEAIFWGGLLK